MANYQNILRQAHQAIADVADNADSWRAFLRSAAYTTHYAFPNQALIYSQRPGATMLADIDTWNRAAGRWVNRGAHGVASLGTAATWIYFDEIHVLLKDPMSSNFLYSSWKRFRKYNAYATGISQDIQDYLDNPVAYALLSNSEFVIMLRQSKSLEALERLYGLSKPQLEFLRNASEGHGIIKMGNSMIPFSNLEPKDTAVYKLITTKPGEATAEK